MRITKPMLFAGVAVALAGVTAVAAAERARVHVMTVQLPDGSIEQIHYIGNAAPRILVRDAAAPAAAEGFLASAFGEDSPFAEMDRVSAEMNRQAALMMRQASMMASQAAHASAGTPQMAALANAPAGVHYSFVSTTSSNGKTCTTSVQMTSQGNGKAPQMLRNVSGDCGTAVQRQTGPSLTAAPAPAQPAVPPTLTAAPAVPKTQVPADSI